MDKETEILARLAANHLFLAQFEPLRATILVLRERSPELALAVLQTIVARAGRFDGVLWSRSCPSPSLLAYLAALELSQFENASSAWSFDAEALQLRAEFLLLVQHLIDRVSESLRKNFDLESIGEERERDGSGESESFLDERDDKSADLRAASGEWHDALGVLDRVLDLGVNRLKADAVLVSNVDDDEPNRSQDQSQAIVIEEVELKCLRKAISDYADVFDALCLNIERQVRGWEGYDSSGLAITAARRDEAVAVAVAVAAESPEGREENDVKVLGLIQRSVQLAHLDAIKECVKEGNVDGAVSRIRFLHLDYGVVESEYRYAIYFKFFLWLKRRDCFNRIVEFLV